MRRTRKSVIFIIMLFFITFFASMSLDTTTKAYTDEFLARLMDNELTLVPREEGEIFIMNRCEEAVYSYTSSNNKIVYVDNKYHSVMGISKGTATITVTESLDGVSRSLGEVKVTVVGKYIEKELTIAYSDGLESGYFPIYNREDDAIYTFKSSDPKTVEIRANGYLYAHKYGTAYISVTEI